MNVMENEVIINELSIQMKNLELIDECINDVKNALVDISKVYKEEQKNIDEAYQKGLTDAWKVARKIAVLPHYGGMEGTALKTIFGTLNIHEIFDAVRPSEAIAKLKIYEEQKNDNEIKVGDEVKSLNDLGEEIKGFLPWIVTIIDEDYCQGIDKEGRMHATQKVRACKTGRHFDISKILEEMRE